MSWYQQGTGSQRALFWTMLKVRSKLNAITNLIAQNSREIVDTEKQITKLEREVETNKKEETKQKNEKKLQDYRQSLPNCVQRSQSVRSLERQISTRCRGTCCSSMNRRSTSSGRRPIGK